MNLQTHSTLDNSSLDDLRDVHGILVMLSVALAVIASPATPVICSRVLAVVAQHSATAWALVLDDAIESMGGDQ
ncbi:hypothetical protein NL64_18985 [Pseudomonas fluorescens]|uniref:hypothetical protein n=1 Tax=Pseudomonas fluorescens TaxID=294 RepID=UPI00054B58EF|nr:hypothetical protein [Pseudomonas fluorescens]KII30212.1 hypothetical protein NL64_18985 [Pseudomonas fluorescens]